MSLRLVTSNGGTGGTHRPQGDFHREIQDAWRINDQKERMRVVFDIVTSWVGCVNTVFCKHGAASTSHNKISGPLLVRLLLHIGYSYAFESGIKRYTSATFIYEVEKLMKEAGLDPNDY